MMQIVSTLALAAAFAAPASAQTAHLAAPQQHQPQTVAKAQTSVAMRDDESGYTGGTVARDGRESLSQLQNQTRQLGATQ